MIHGFKNGGDYRTYRLADTLAKYDQLVSKYIAKMAKRMTVQMKSHTFQSFDPISIIGF